MGEFCYNIWSLFSVPNTSVPNSLGVCWGLEHLFVFNEMIVTGVFAWLRWRLRLPEGHTMSIWVWDTPSNSRDRKTIVVELIINGITNHVHLINTP